MTSTKPKRRPHKIDEPIKRKKELVTQVAEKGEPLHILHHRVALVSVDDKNSASIRGAMNRMFLNADVAIGAAERADHLVMITGDVDNARAFARFAQNLG